MGVAMSVLVGLLTSQCWEPAMFTAVGVANAASVTTRSDTLGAKDIIERSATVRTRMGPVLDGLEH
jgi:hypothetical protein